MSVDIQTFADALRAATISLANSLLKSDSGISEIEYIELVHLLTLVMPPDEVSRFKRMVRATDGMFYFTDGVSFLPSEVA